MKKDKNYLAMVIIGVIIFSTFEVVTRTMNGQITGTTLTFYRFLIGGFVLLPFGIRDMRKRHAVMEGKDIAVLVLLSFILVALSMTISQYGIFFSNASMSAVVFSSNPLFIALFASIFLKEHMNHAKITGLVLGLIGLGLTCTKAFSGDNYSLGFAIGVGFIFIAMLLFSIYSVFNKKYIVSKIGPTAATSFTSISGAITLLPIMLIQQAVTGQNVFAADFTGIIPQFLYCSIVGTGLAYLFYFVGLANIDMSTGSMTFLLKPPLASLFAMLFLGEKITIQMICGTALILYGMFVAIRVKADRLGYIWELRHHGIRRRHT